jgi:hypothetical protein
MPIHSAPNSGTEEPKVADIFVAHHRDTESTERTFFFARSGDPPASARPPLSARQEGRPEGAADGGQVPIGQENAALRAPQLHLKATSRNGSWTEVPLAEGDGMFPWPSSPGQGNNPILCVLCGSVVNSRAMPAHSIQMRSKGYKHFKI